MSSWSGSVSRVTAPDETGRPSMTAKSRGEALGWRRMELERAKSASIRDSDAPQSINAKVGIGTPSTKMVMERMMFSSGWKLGAEKQLAADEREVVTCGGRGGWPRGVSSTAAGPRSFPADRTLHGWRQKHAQGRVGWTGVGDSRGRRALGRRSTCTDCSCDGGPSPGR